MNCPHCGFSGVAFTEFRNIEVQGNLLVPCPDCGEESPVEKGVYSYEPRETSYYVQVIARLKITKKDAKRIVKQITTAEDISLLPSSLSVIDPTIGHLAEEAVRGPEPKDSLKKIGAVVAILTGLGATILLGLEITEKVGLLDEVQAAVDKYVNGKNRLENQSESQEKKEAGPTQGASD